MQANHQNVASDRNKIKDEGHLVLDGIGEYPRPDFLCYTADYAGVFSLSRKKERKNHVNGNSIKAKTKKKKRRRMKRKICNTLSSNVRLNFILVIKQEKEAIKSQQMCTLTILHWERTEKMIH